MKVKKEGSERYLHPFTFVTECTTEKYCNTTGIFNHLANWSNSYINFEMQDGVDVEIVITKLFGDPIKKAVVHPYTASKNCVVKNGKAYVTINKTGLFTVDINGQMDDQDTGGFQLEFVSISRVISHMTCYSSSALIGGKFIL